MKRNIIRIDEAKCTGCGECIPDCPEGALKIVDGKVKLVKESLCDGLGACVGRCPFGALTIEERDAEAFDEQEAQKNMDQAGDREHHQHSHSHTGACPGGMMKQWERPADSVSIGAGSALRQWPVELKLLNPDAPYFQDAHLLVCADCVPFAFADFHHQFLAGKVLVVFCPKLDNALKEYIEKLSLILRRNNIRSISVVHMEVPCCSATVHIIKEALKLSGKEISVEEHTVSLRGEVF